MTNASLSSRIHAFDPTLPIADNRTPPAVWYTDTDVYDLEATGVFANCWLVAGRTDQLTEPGSFFTLGYLGRPIVVTRAEDGEIRAFYNVCSHHGTCVAEGEGRAEALVCPYHGWTYALDGSLRKAPRAGRLDHHGKLGLRSVAVTVWEPLVLIHLGESPTPFDTLDCEREALALDGLRFVHRTVYTLECNWKVFADNYLDGGYHVPHMHGELAGGLDLTGYQTRLGAGYSVQTCPGSGDSDRVGETAVYLWLYPNLALNRYGPWLDVNLVLPLGPRRCQVIFDYFHEGPVDDQARDRALAESDRVQQEDIAICDRVQAGLDSGVYDRGVYAPNFETPMYHFHQMLARDLRAAVGL